METDDTNLWCILSRETGDTTNVHFSPFKSFLVIPVYSYFLQL